jgi:hypothetical protein
MLSPEPHVERADGRAGAEGDRHLIAQQCHGGAQRRHRAQPQQHADAGADR